MEYNNETDKNKQEYITLRIRRRTLNCVIGVTAIILYWIVYIWQNNLADMGNYKFFSYRFHEMYCMGYAVIPAITALWFGWVLVDAIRKKAWRKNIAILIILASLMFLQIGLINFQSKSLYRTIWTELVDIPDEEHIVILYHDEEIILETDSRVTNLVKIGEIYGFFYKCNDNFPGEGKLLRIECE